MPKQTLAGAELHRLARLGAMARLKEIEAEAATIRGAFPGLGRAQPAKKGAPEKPARRKRHMSPAAREAARQRMHDYWARKKAAQATASDVPGNGGADRATDAPARKTRKARAAKGRRARKAR